MNSLAFKINGKRLVVMILTLLLVLGLSLPAVSSEYALGDIPLDPQTYQRFLKTFPSTLRDALPTSYDARDEGIVTPAKDQGSCGSCWAFASVGALESHLLKKWGYGPTDLSEQQQLVCNNNMYGCSGGSSTAQRFWETRGPITEICFPYTANDNDPCNYTCDEMVTRVTGWHTVGATDFKTSLYNEGPSYWRFTVYSDFYTYWNSGNPGAVYVSKSGATLQGGHAVLLIGWDDSKNAYLCKNSWGANGGPNGDGTFWIAYSGHYYNLGFGMSNFDIVNMPESCDFELTDSNGYSWCLNEIKRDGSGIYLQGSCDTGVSPLKDAFATFLFKNSGVDMTAYGGASGAVFHYNWKLIGTSGSGIWTSSDGSNGTVTVNLASPAQPIASEYTGRGPDHMTVPQAVVDACDYSLTDSFGYSWCMNIFQRDASGVWLNGTCNTGSLPLKSVIGTYLPTNSGVNMTAYGGATDAIFTANWMLTGTGGSGIWASGAGGGGSLTINIVSSADRVLGVDTETGAFVMP